MKPFEISLVLQRNLTIIIILVKFGTNLEMYDRNCTTFTVHICCTFAPL